VHLRKTENDLINTINKGPTGQEVAMNTQSIQHKQHTIFGAGQVGMKLAHLLLDQGIAVRIVRRGKAKEEREGLTWMQGDITDQAFARMAAEGSTVVYNCTNPAAYHRWDELLPPLYDAVLDAAKHAGARLVMLDNLYMYGRPEEVPFSEDTKSQPCSKKGELRKRLAEKMMAAHARGEVQVAIGRASDYFGPDTPEGAVFMPRTFDQLMKGKVVETLGNPDTRHSYSYTPDVARGLAALGTSEKSWGRVWHLPVAWQGTTRGLLNEFATALGQEKPRIRKIPAWAIKGLGLVIPLMGAVAEMLYQWDGPFVVDDSRFVDTFGFGATPVNEAIRETLAPLRPEAGTQKAA
jgi:nucleoside-diphosphate-sugar epimerase